MIVLFMAVETSAVAVLGIVVGILAAHCGALQRALKRARTKLAEARAERNAALDQLEYSPDAQRPAWTEGAPQEAINAEFDAITHEAWIRGES